MDRNQLVKQLSKYEKVDTNKSDLELQKKLYKFLIDNHPIHKKLQMLSDKKIENLHSELELKITSKTRKTYQRDIAHYFFIKFEESPLTNLEITLQKEGTTTITRQKGIKRKRKHTIVSFGLINPDNDINNSGNKKKQQKTEERALGNKSSKPELPANSNIVSNLIDPYSIFSGIRLSNTNGYICYLNSIVNGLLSIKYFRELIPFMETHIRDIFTNLFSEKSNHLEVLRQHLHDFSPNFHFGIHSDPIEAILRIIEMINLESLYEKSLVELKEKRICTQCGYQEIISIKEMEPNVLFLPLSEKETVQEEINSYIKSICINKTKQSFCKECQKPQNIKMTKSVTTNKILIICICRFEQNEEKNFKQIIPDKTIHFGPRSYRLKSLTKHHGTSIECGHYKSSILLQNENWKLFDDTDSKLSNEDITEPYVLYYEEIETNNSVVPNINEPSNTSVNTDEPMDIDSYSDNETNINEPSNTSVNTENNIYHYENIPDISSKPDTEIIINARIVRHNTKLKIQCLTCQKTPQNIITHSKNSNCSVAFNDSDKIRKLKTTLNTYQNRERSKRKYEKNKPKILENKRLAYQNNPEPKKAAARRTSEKSYKNNPEPKKEAARRTSEKSYKNNPEPKKEAARRTYKNNPQPKKDASKKFYWEKNDNNIWQNFMNKQLEGLSYVCICCHRLLFKTSVDSFNIEDPKDDVFKAITEFSLEHCITPDDTMKNENRFWLCYNCKNNLKNGKMPNMCHANGLDINPLPKELQDLTFLETMMIKKKLLFIRIREKLTSGMKRMIGKVVNVPISDTDLLKTATSLPRTTDDLATVNVAFHRKKNVYQHRKPELVRPKKVNDALKYLQKHHPSYKDFDVETLNEDNKFMFANLPLIGQCLEDEEKLMNLNDAFNHMKSSPFLSDLLNPQIIKSEENYQAFFDALIDERASQNKDSFIHALLHQIR